MHLIDKVERKIKALPFDVVISFSEVIVKNISKDTIRQYLHRLHDKGVISIVDRGYFKKIEPFSEFLFVYGSLKKGFDNHKLLTKHTKRIGKAKTISKFGMYEDSFGNYPYLMQTAINKIEGELYQIQREELLKRIDEFEGAPDYYYRKKIKVQTHRGIKSAFVYISTNTVIPKEQKPLKVWEDNTDYKVQKLHDYLEKL
jgi:gamma-glutamylaminecyclotransferase